jgi:hyperosmotically inducible periplasmic protein
MKRIRPTISVLGGVAVAAALAACGKAGESSTAGQKIDGVVASAERAATDARDAGKEAAANVASAARDIGITAKVNAEFAKDPALSALRIDVDTTEGRVALNGSAPSDSARERATSLARSVEGVVAVDNRLKVEPKS